MTVLLTNARERNRFLKFAVVGAIGAVVDFGLANTLIYTLHAPLVLAGTVSFIAAILSNFIWNRYWTYPDSRSKPVWQQLVQFAFINVMGLCIRVPVLRFLEPPMKSLFTALDWPLLSPNFLGKNVTLAVAVILVMFWNFFVNRYWTYNDVS